MSFWETLSAHKLSSPFTFTFTGKTVDPGLLLVAPAASPHLCYYCCCSSACRSMDLLFTCGQLQNTFHSIPWWENQKSWQIQTNSWNALISYWLLWKTDSEPNSLNLSGPSIAMINSADPQHREWSEVIWLYSYKVYHEYRTIDM